MKSIKDLLIDKKVSTLIQICRVFGLRGYTTLRKEGTINLITENFKNPQFQESIKFLVPDNDTVALIFKNILENKNEINYVSLRNEMLQKRSSATFRENYRKLISKYIIFEDEKSDDDILYLPKEFTKIAKELIEKRIKEVEAEAEIEDIGEEIEVEKDRKEIKNIEQLFYSKKFLTVSDLQDALMSRNLKISGTKSELIERLLYESNEDLNNILGILFGKTELKDICRAFKLAVSGTKDELIDRLLERLPPLYPDRVFIKEKLEMMASGKAKIAHEVKTKEVEVKKKVNLKKEVLNILNSYNLDYRSITKGETFEGQILSLLQNLKLFYTEKFSDLFVERIPKEPVILLKLGKQNVAVYVFYFTKSKQTSTPVLKGRFLQNAVSYKYKYSKDLVTYIYDPIGRLNIEDRENFAKEYDLIYKKESHFKN